MAEKNVDALKRIRSNLYGKIKNKQQGRLVDCCKEYKFIRDFDTYNFNKKMNGYGITHLVLNERYDLGEMIENTIINPIKHNSNIVIGIIGETGSGKSELAQTFSLISRQANKKYKYRDVEIYICWTPEDLFNVLMKLKKGDVIMKDESPKAFGEGARIEKWSIENALAVIRKLENTLIFCDPLDIKINMCDLYLETAGMNFKTRTNRFMVLNKQKMYFGHIYTKLHNNTEFRNLYLKQKDAFVEKTMELAGKFLSGLRKDKEKKKTIDVEFEQEKTDKEKNKMINIFVQILKNTIRDTKKHKARNIFIWEHRMKNKEKYSFKYLADNYELSPDTIEFVFYTLNKKINNYPLVKKIKLKFF